MFFFGLFLWANGADDVGVEADDIGNLCAWCAALILAGRLSLRQGTALVSLRLPDAQPALRAAEYLQNQAVKFNSRVLFSMATRLSSNADPMASVRTMLNNLITTLEKESSEVPWWVAGWVHESFNPRSWVFACSNRRGEPHSWNLENWKLASLSSFLIPLEEMEHRDWCENEMSANEKAREDRTSSVKTLKTQVRPVSSLLYSFIRFDHGPRIQALPAQDSKAFGPHSALFFRGFWRSDVKPGGLKSNQLLPPSHGRWTQLRAWWPSWARRSRNWKANYLRTRRDSGGDG